MPLLAFAVLQVLDTLTTLCFLQHGVAEANPLMRWVLVWSAQPALGLAAAKLASLAPAFWAWRSRRYGLLRKINLLFGGCVLWNLVALSFAGPPV